jgi:hypothetical protein
MDHRDIKTLCLFFPDKMSFDEEPSPEYRLGPAPAPLDLGRLEMDARAAATKHVASLLQVCFDNC